MKGLYKAKSKQNGEWVEGSLLALDWEADYVYIVKEFPRASTFPVSVIIADNMVLVDKETLCRYAFSLKTGKKVFEHDVLEGHLDRIYVEDVTRVEVVWGKYGWATKDKHSEDTDPVTEVDEVMWERVCGNIFDNPELMEGEGRLERMKRTHPKRYEYVMGGGEFDENGMWIPNEKGLGFKFVIDWLNENGNLHIKY